jgi:Tol biopolymer transport system component
LERVVKKCLEKDPEERWQSARDLTSELKWLAEAGGTLPATVAGAKPILPKRRRELLYAGLAIVFLVAAIVSTVFYLRVVPTPARAIISEILPPEKTQFNFGYRGGDPGGLPMLSPDGTAVAFSATDANGKTLLWIRSFDSLAAQPLAGTEGGGWPFWSANGRSLGFLADSKLKVIELSGGPARVVADAPSSFYRGVSWNREETLLFVPDFTKGLYQVAASGGDPVPVLELDKSKYVGWRWPKFLPDGKHFLYRALAVDPAFSGIYFASLDGKENRLLLKGEKPPNVTYGSGYLLYLLDKTLMAQAFDPERGQLKGDAHPVAERIASDSPGTGFFDVSENGVLIYQTGDSLSEKRITWFDRAGKELSAGEGGSYGTLRLSPDGAKLAFTAGNPTTDIWVDELARGVHIRLTNDPGVGYGNPTWSPDGRRILFGGAARAGRGIYQMNSNGAGGKELLLAAENPDQGMWPTSWSPDGRFILYVRGIPAGIQDVEILPLVGDRKPRLFVQNAFDGQFSPDGRWVAYTSTESGKHQIYVVPFDATKVLDTQPGTVTGLTDRYQISASRGAMARWRGDGKEIFYLEPTLRQMMMAVEVDGRDNSFAPRKEQALFKLPGGFGFYDAAPDGKRFVTAILKVNPNTPLTLVVNWTALLSNKP